MTTLRRLRQHRGWTLQELAQRAGIHYVTLARIETGVIDPRMSTVWKIGKALKATMSELVEGYQPPSTKRRSHGTDKTKRRLVR